MKDKRRRIKRDGLQAELVFHSATQEITLEADIIDITHNGIRIKLKQPIATDMTGNVKINMTLPESHTPFSVHGILKHQTDDHECEVHYDHVHGSIDDLLFECEELDETTMLIKSL